MKILVLAGKGIDDKPIRAMMGDKKYQLAHYASVLRGVCRLEKTPIDLVLLIPDIGDISWLRALNRIRKEFKAWSVLIAEVNEEQREKAFDAGAYDIVNPAHVKPAWLDRCLHFLSHQRSLEEKLHHQADMLEWLERTGRFGIWEMDAERKTSWSKGLRRILRDNNRLSEDFSSIRQFIHPEDLAVYDHAHKATPEQEWPLNFEYRVNHEDGNTSHLHTYRRIDLDAKGNLARAYGIVHDITPEKTFKNSLSQHDAILQVVSSFAQRFLRDMEWQAGMNNALKALGKATNVTRTFIIRKHKGCARTARMSMLYEWTAPSVKPILNRPEMKGQLFEDVASWRTVLAKRKAITEKIRDIPPQERTYLDPTQVKAIMLVPIFVGNEWWGTIGMSDHHQERDWTPTEIESITMVADMFGSAILRASMESQLIEANSALEKAKNLALEASKAKSRFLANMSHEIRTPISGILGMTEMTIATELTADQRKHMDMIHGATRSLLALVNDILDISKIEAEKMELKPQDFEFRPSIKTVIRPFELQADAQNILFRYKIAETVPSHVHGDPDRLGQVLINLIGNAMKFTEHGLVELHVDVAEQEAHRVCLRFSIRDTGKGIPTEKLDTIFNRFTQVDSSTKKKHQGTGLGLTISKKLVEMMGGQISVESKLGHGSTLSFSVWFAIPKQVRIQQESTPSIAAPPMRLNILLAEDNLLNQKFLVHFLSRAEHTVTVAGNGTEVLDVLHRQGQDIDVILMDIQMPEMDGLETTKAIRQSNGKHFDKNIPIIALTAYTMKDDRERMLKAGMNDYVSKPVDMKLLSAAIAQAVVDRQATAQSPFPTPGAGQAACEKNIVNGASASLDMDSLMDHFGGDAELLKEVLELFIIEADQKLLKLDATMQSGDLKKLGEVLHSITNIAGHVLAKDICILSRGLEKLCYKGARKKVMSGIAKLRPMLENQTIAVKECIKTLR